MRKVEFFTYADVVKMAESTETPVEAVEFLNRLLAERGRVVTG